MNDTPIRDAHVDAYLLVATEYVVEGIDYIERYETLSYWRDSAVKAMKTAKKQLASINKLQSLRARLLAMETIIGLVDGVNEAFCDQWSFGIAVLMEHACKRLKDQRRAQAKKKLKVA